MLGHRADATTSGEFRVQCRGLMSFTSLAFALFFPAVTVVYFVLPQHWRWMLLLAASYYFYASWNPVYLLILLVSTAVDYCAGRAIEQAGGRHRLYFLLISLAVNLGLLFTFKYFNFLGATAERLGALFGLRLQLWQLHVLLPVGLSFYTFQSLSYIIDIYRGRRPAEKHIGLFATFVSFFPQLVAGPIERSQQLLPQFRETHRFEYQRVAGGLQLMAWGFFKKMVIADSAAVLVDALYNDPAHATGLGLLLATYLFAYQIYCDFSAYSDIAKGTAQVLGFALMDNFHRPYASTSIHDFWRRWHISLSAWFRDYLYIPLGGNRVRAGHHCVNLLIVFLISGLWHGANWTFVLWGLLHGLYMVFSVLTKHLRRRLAQLSGLQRLPRIHHVFQVLLTFHLTLFAWIFFRANSQGDALSIIAKIGGALGTLLVHNLFLGVHALQGMFGNIVLDRYELLILLLAILALECIQYLQQQPALQRAFATNAIWIRWPSYYVLIFAILIFGRYDNHAFIYFQF